MAICWEALQRVISREDSIFLYKEPSDTTRHASKRNFWKKIWYIAKEAISEIPCQVDCQIFA